MSTSRYCLHHRRPSMSFQPAASLWCLRLVSSVLHSMLLQTIACGCVCACLVLVLLCAVLCPGPVGILGVLECSRARCNSSPAHLYLCTLHLHHSTPSATSATVAAVWQPLCQQRRGCRVSSLRHALERATETCELRLSMSKRDIDRTASGSRAKIQQQQ